MKTIMTFEVEDNEEALALLNAVKNQVKINDLYDSCFRKHIKYSDNEIRVNTVQELWDEIREYFND